MRPATTKHNGPQNIWTKKKVQRENLNTGPGGAPREEEEKGKRLSRNKKNKEKNSQPSRSPCTRRRDPRSDNGSRRRHIPSIIGRRHPGWGPYGYGSAQNSLFSTSHLFTPAGPLEGQLKVPPAPVPFCLCTTFKEEVDTPAFPSNSSKLAGAPAHTASQYRSMAAYSKRTREW